MSVRLWNRPTGPWICGLVVASLAGSAWAARVTQIEFLGEARLPGGLMVDGTPVGGLSGIAFDPDSGRYLVVSDDPSGQAPARFYTVEIELSEGRLTRDAVEVIGVTAIGDPSGGPMAKLTSDPEGLVRLDPTTLFISSEGQIERGVGPFVRRYALDGTYEQELQLPARYAASPGRDRGPRHNLGFESLTLSPDGRRLFTAMENALQEDGSPATIDSPSPSRLLEFDTASGELQAEYLYFVEPVAVASPLADGLELSGLVDLVVLDETHFLALERSFSAGTANVIRLYEFDLEGATDIKDRASLLRVDLGQIVPVHKRLLLDLAELDVYLDNLEGLTLGPTLPDGRRVLILVSDDNFNPILQVSQFLAFAIDERPVEIEQIQGAGHRSPLEGRWVRGVEGIVTAVGRGEPPRIWLEQVEGRGDAHLSRGLEIGLPDKWPTPLPGDRIAVDGRVSERQRPGDLGVTRIDATALEVTGHEPALPPPVRLGPEGRVVPTEVVDDDGLLHYEPRYDGLDFWESLEGMRVVIAAPLVVGATNRYREITVDAADGDTKAGRSTAGGLLLRPGDANPERLVVEFPELDSPLEADVGARFEGDLSGVVDYGYGRFRLQALGRPPPLQPSARRPERTPLSRGRNRLTIGSFNVMNLGGSDAAERFTAVARIVVDHLGSPDIIALQEIQDDNGATDDGTVSASRTLERLLQAIVAAGGPAYEVRQVDPRDGRDGGLPGANIRVAFLFDATRIESVYDGPVGPEDAVSVVNGARGPRLSTNPGRIAPREVAFAGDEIRGFSASRKSLAAEFEFAGQRLFVINNHWCSKSADDGIFGSQQPPRTRSEDQRSQQARLVADLVSRILAIDPEAAIVALGDFNEHEFRAPLHILESAGLHNLIHRLVPEDRYTFNFGGNSQVLDHVLVSPRLSDPEGVRIDIVHVNADFAHSTAASDHDPLVAEIRFDRLP